MPASACGSSARPWSEWSATSNLELILVGIVVRSFVPIAVALLRASPG
jgi:hypothetical protein